MQNYIQYPDKKLIEIYQRLREDYKTETSRTDGEVASKVYDHFIKTIKAELESRGILEQAK